jgi:BlaI family transcriptional regulator, penicillinase repressor
MADNALPNPTNAELQILCVLWHRGPSTVREVLEELGDNRRVGYTTVLKLLQIMTDKKLVTRDSATRTHVYQAAASEEATQRRLVSDLMDRAFGGSAHELIQQALSSRRASAEELDAIRRMLDELERDKS